MHFLTVFISFWLLQLCVNPLFKHTLQFFSWFICKEDGLGVPIHGKPFQSQYLKQKRKYYTTHSIANARFQELVFITC